MHISHNLTDLLGSILIGGIHDYPQKGFKPMLVQPDINPI